MLTPFILFAEHPIEAYGANARSVYKGDMKDAGGAQIEPWHFYRIDNDPTVYVQLQDLLVFDAEKLQLIDPHSKTILARILEVKDEKIRYDYDDQFYFEYSGKKNKWKKVSKENPEDVEEVDFDKLKNPLEYDFYYKRVNGNLSFELVLPKKPVEE